MAMPISIPAHVALALIVVKTKPVDNSVEDYIRDLRQIIVDRSRRHPVDDQQYVDGTLFWKRAYEKTEGEKTELQNRIFELEEQIQKMRDVSSPPMSEAISKRKSETQAAKANMQTKRRKLNKETTAKDEIDLGLILKNNTTNPGCHAVLRAIYGLRTCSNIDKTNANTGKNVRLYCCSIIDALKAASTTSCDKQMSPTSNTTVEEVCNVLNKTWSVVQNSFGRLSAQNDQMEVASSISHMVFLVQSLLGQLQQYSLDQADLTKKSLKRSKQGQHSDKACLTPQNKLQNHEYCCKAVTVTLGRMIDAIDFRQLVSLKLFEGLSCAVIDHVGSAMSLMVFGDSKTDKSGNKGVMPPPGLLHVSHIDTETALLTVQLVAPFLVYILRKVITKAEDPCFIIYLEPSKETAGSQSKLVIDMKERLQCTLLRGIFGNDDESSCTTAMKRADPCSKLNIDEILAASQVDENSPNWFIAQVWEHLGWDALLAKD